MIAVIDYDAGNLFSVKNALDYLELPSVLTSDPAEIERADAVILPGVGAFGDAMDKLNRRGLTRLLREQAGKKPLLGICLGMQVLFEKGFEFGEHEGLGLLPGSVERMAPDGLKIPHMGWNSLRFHNPSPLLAGVPEGSYVYFVHSFAARTDAENLCAVADYGMEVPALVAKGLVFGAQFHPEKSADVGLAILRNFGGLAT